MLYQILNPTLLLFIKMKTQSFSAVVYKESFHIGTVMLIGSRIETLINPTELKLKKYILIQNAPNSIPILANKFLNQSLNSYTTMLYIQANKQYEINKTTCFMIKTNC